MDNGDTTIDVLYTAVDCGDSLDGLFVQFVAVDCAAQSLPGASYAAHEDQSYSSVFGAGNVLTTTDDADSDADKQRLVYDETGNSDDDTDDDDTTTLDSPVLLAGPLTWVSDGFDVSGETITISGFADSDAVATFLATTWLGDGPTFNSNRFMAPMGSMGEFSISSSDLFQNDASITFMNMSGQAFEELINFQQELYAWSGTLGD